MTHHTRRDALRLGAAAASAGALTGLAGCSSIPFLGGGSSYRQWLFEPGTITNDDHYTFRHENVEAVRNNENNLNGDAYDNMESVEDRFPLEPANVDFDDVTSTLSMSVTGSLGVVTGNFPAADVATELQDEDYTEESQHEGYTLFEQNGRNAIGVTDNTLVHAAYGTGSDDAIDLVETAIDTNVGNEKRYAAENEDCKTLLDSVGSGTFVRGGTQREVENTNADWGQFEGVVATGAAATINGQTTAYRMVYVYDSEGDVDVADVEDFVDTIRDRNDRLEEVGAPSRSGRSVVISATMDTDEVTEF